LATADVRNKAKVHSGVCVAPVWIQSGSETLTMPFAFHVVPQVKLGSAVTNEMNKFIMERYGNPHIEFKVADMLTKSDFYNTRRLSCNENAGMFTHGTLLHFFAIPAHNPNGVTHAQEVTR